MNCSIVVYYRRAEPRNNEPLYDEFLNLATDFLYPMEKKLHKTKPRCIANKFCRFLGPSLCRGSTVLPN